MWEIQSSLEQYARRPRKMPWRFFPCKTFGHPGRLQARMPVKPPSPLLGVLPQGSGSDSMKCSCAVLVILFLDHTTHHTPHLGPRKGST